MGDESVNGEAPDAAFGPNGPIVSLGHLHEMVRAAEEASRKANSESGYAYNAKQNAEEHAKTVAQIKGTVEAESTWIATTRKAIEETAQVISTLRTDAEGAVRSLSTSKSDAEGSVGAVRASEEKGKALLAAIETAHGEAAAGGKRIAEIASETSQARAAVDAQAAAVLAQHNQIGEMAAKAKVDGAAIASDRARGESLAADLETVRDTAKSAQARVTEYEAELVRLRRDFDGLRSQIEALLPGATSAGLASAFQDQKSRFDRPQWISLTVFFVAVSILALVGWLQVRAVAEAAGNGVAGWDLILRHITNRLLLVVPLVWIASVAYRSYSTAQRVQEDYAFKEAVSRSFEGYKREMANLPLTTEQIAPLLRLCENVLATLAQRPGRLYEGKHDDITPLTPVLKTATELTSKLQGILKKDGQ